MQRQEILRRITEHLEQNIDELTRSLESYEAASDLDEGDTVDPDDFSKAAEYKEMQMRMKIQIDQVNAQLARLGELANKKVSSIEAGAIVETDQNIIFIGVSFPTLSLDGKELRGITTETPIYASLKGKAKGDTFNLGKEEYTILAIH